MKINLDISTVKGLSVVALSSYVVLALITGCNKSEDKKPAPEVPRVSRVSVLGKSSAIGYFPDGTKSEPLSEAKLAKLVKMSEGMAVVNGAVGVLTYDSGSKQNEKNRVSMVIGNKFESIQALLSSSAVSEMIKNPQEVMSAIAEQVDPTADNRKKLEGEITTSCTTTQVSPEASVTGSDTAKHMIKTGSTKMSGEKCPVSTDFGYVANIDLKRLSGENAAAINGKVVFSGSLELKKKEKQEALDFVREALKGELGLEVVGVDKSAELAFGLDLSGKLETKTQGAMEARVLTDVYADAPGGTMTNFSMSISIILKTAESNVLLQVKSTLKPGTTTQETEVYLNGTRIELKK